MSVGNTKKLSDILSANEELRAELKDILKNTPKVEVASAFEGFAKKNEAECTLLEFVIFKNAQLKELSPEDLSKIDAGRLLFPEENWLCK